MYICSTELVEFKNINSTLNQINFEDNQKQI